MESIDIKFRVNTDEFTKGLKQVENAANKTADTAKKAAQTIDKAYAEEAEKIKEAFSGVGKIDFSELTKEANKALEASKKYLTELSQGAQNISSAETAIEGLSQAMDKNRATIAENETELNKLYKAEKELRKVENAMKAKGASDSDRKAVGDSITAVYNEISARTELDKQLRENQKTLDEYSTAIESLASVSAEDISAVRQEFEQLADETQTTQQAMERTQEGAGFTQGNDELKRMRQELRSVTYELAMMEQAGKRGTKEYEELRKRAGAMRDAFGDAQRQISLMANDDLGLAGIASAASGAAGAMSAATGTMALFGEEGEELQQIMLKVQSAMAITNGLQQVAATLNKDSAASIGLVNKAKQLWLKMQAAATTTQTANTAATAANTTATTANAAAASAGTKAGFSLSGAFRAVGVALKSIPAFGWIVAAIGALVVVISKMVSESGKWSKAMAEIEKASAVAAAKVEATFATLKAGFEGVGESAEAQAKWVRENQKQFDELGISIKSAAEAQEYFNGTQSETARQLSEQQERLAKLKERYEKERTEVAELQAEIRADEAAAATAFGDDSVLGDFGRNNILGVQIEAARWVYNKAAAAYKSGKVAALDGGAKDITQQLQTEIAATQGVINELQQQLGDTYRQTAEDNLKNQQWYTDQQLAIEGKRIEGIKSAAVRSKAQIELAYKQELEAIARERETLLNEQGGILTKNQSNVFAAREQLALTARMQAQQESADKLAYQRKQLINQATQSEIAAMAAGAAKTRRQIEQEYREQIETINEAQRNDPDNADVYERQREAAMQAKVKAEADLQRQLAEELRTLQETAQDIQIETMEEGFEREMQVLNIQHQRKLAEIERQRREQVEANGGELTAEQAALFTSLNEAENKSYSQNVTKLQLSEFETMQRERAKIEADYSAMILAAEKEGDTKRVQHLRDEMAAALKDFNAKQTSYILTYSAKISKAFDNIENTSRNAIKESIAELEQLLADVNDENSTNETAQALRGDKEAVLTITARIEELKAKLAGDNPFLKIKNGIVGIINHRDDIDQLAADTQVFVGGMQGAASFLSEVASSIENFPSLKSQAQELKDIAGIVDKAGSGAAMGAQIGGGVGAIVGAVGGAAMALVNIWTESKQAELQAQQELNNFAEKARLTAFELEDIYDTIYGTNSIERSFAAYEKAEGLLQSYAGKLRDLRAYQATLDLFAFGSKGDISEFEKNYYAEALTNGGGSLSEYKAELDKLANGMRTQRATSTTTGALWWRKTTETQLADHSELWNADGSLNVKQAQNFLETQSNITSECKQTLQAIIDTQAAYDELNGVLEESVSNFFGSWGADITTAIYEGIYNGAEAWQTFETMGAKAIAEIGKQMAQELIVTEYLNGQSDKLKQAFSKMGNDNGADLMNVISETIDGLSVVQQRTQEFAELWESQATAKGFDVASYYSTDTEVGQKGLSGALATASQESIDLLAGQTNAVRVNQVKQLEILEQSIILQTQMSSGIAASAAALDTLKNTSREIADNVNIMARGNAQRGGGEL